MDDLNEKVGTFQSLCNHFCEWTDGHPLLTAIGILVLPGSLIILGGKIIQWIVERREKKKQAKLKDCCVEQHPGWKQIPTESVTTTYYNWVPDEE